MRFSPCARRHGVTESIWSSGTRGMQSAGELDHQIGRPGSPPSPSRIRTAGWVQTQLRVPLQLQPPAHWALRVKTG
jgi:hypothetical protein